MADVTILPIYLDIWFLDVSQKCQKLYTQQSGSRMCLEGGGESRTGSGSGHPAPAGGPSVVVLHSAGS